MMIIFLEEGLSSTNFPRNNQIYQYINYFSFFTSMNIYEMKLMFNNHDLTKNEVVGDGSSGKVVKFDE